MIDSAQPADNNSKDQVGDGESMKIALLVFNFTVAVVLALVITRDVTGERQREIESAYGNLELVTAALAEHTQQTLAAIDLALITMVSRASGIDWNDPSQLGDMQQVVENRQAASTNTFAFYILDTDGRLLISSRTPNPEPADLSMMEEYIVHRDGIHDGVYIAASRLGIVGNSAGQWVINLSRRLETAEGEFVGVAAASLSVDYLVSFYNILRLGEQSAVGLLSINGIVLARSPLVPNLIGSDMSQNSQFLQAVSFADAGRATDVTIQGGIARLSSFRYTWGDQLIVYANIAEQEVLAEWRERTVFKISIAVLMLLLIVGGSTSVLYFTWRRQQWAERTLRERERSLVQINAARAQIEAIFKSISDAVFCLDANWCFVYLNAEAERVLERKAADLIGKNIWEEFPDTVGNEFHECYMRAHRQNRPASLEQFYPPLKKWFSARAFPYDNCLTVYLQDVTQRHDMEERLRQSRKMDALGQLTGGIAHDFNNLLTVILGNIDLLLEYLADKPEHVRSQADVIRLAGERAAELTHRLLAFARRQPLKPQQTDVNQLVLEAKKLLGRTVGEDIDIELVCSDDLWTALVDPHELQNAILNLAINARDARPDGGKLTIETANMIADADYAQVHDISSGRYIMLSISDTGQGMAPDVVEKAFDPFFTTKPEGQGVILDKQYMVLYINPAVTRKSTVSQVKAPRSACICQSLQAVTSRIIRCSPMVLRLSAVMNIYCLSRMTPWCAATR